MPILENTNLLINFDSDKPGFGSISLKAGYYNPGYARSDSVKTPYNNLNSAGQMKLSNSNYHILLHDGIEYSVSGLDWTVTESTENSKDLYGKFDTYGGVFIDVVTAISESEINVGNDRKVVKQELTYFFTLDGKGLIKKVKVTLNTDPNLDNVIQTMKILDFVGVNSVSGSRFDIDSYYFGSQDVGFNYDTLAAYNAAWTTDAGLTVAIARNSVYPNLLPDFNDSGWIAPATIIDNKTLDLKTGDDTHINHFNPYPDNRKHYLIFEVQNIAGHLDVNFSLVRNAIDADTKSIKYNITQNGVQIIEFPAGFGYTWLYVRFKQVTGTSRIYEPSVNYRGLDFSYAAPDGSRLANWNMRNCIRVQSGNPNGETITKTFPGTIRIGDGKGVLLGALSLDNTNIVDGAFKIGFQKLDDSWVDSGTLNMFVDYNEVYGGEIADQFNQWDESLFGVDIPSGVDQIKAIRIEFTTTNAIDWLLDYFIIQYWDDRDDGVGSDDRRNFGMAVEGIRARVFFLRGAHGLTYPANTAITAERVLVNTGLINPGTSKLTFSNASSISSVYVLLDGSHSLSFSSLTDKGYEAIINISGLSDLVFVVEVKNLRTNDTYRIKNVSGGNLTVDIASKEHEQGDSVRVEYKAKFELPSSDYALGTGGVITWQPALYGFVNDRVYADYAVSVRADNVVGLISAASSHTCSTMRVLRLGINVSAPLLSNYDIITFSTTDNSVAESQVIYYPTFGDVDPTLYSTVQSVQDMLENLRVLSRDEPFTPVTRNYNLIPHIAFGGEQIAAEPIQYLIEANQRLNEAGTTNGLVSAGSLSYLRDRDPTNWWEWGGSLLDTGIDYLFSARHMLRNGKTESEVSDNISQHRYFLEVTTFAYEHNKRYPDQASTDYKNDIKYKRVWYYQESGGLYTSRVHGWDDFQESYYTSIIEGGKVYAFRYHYTLVIPAFWSVCTPSSDWGLTEDTIYDKMVKRLNYLCQNYDTEGPIISEMLYYREGFSANDFSLFNTWCQGQGFGVQTDWPRFGPQNYADLDDQQKVWGWKRYQIKKFLTEMATIVHGHNKLLGVNVHVQNIFSIVNVNNPVWADYAMKRNQYGWQVDTLDLNIDRYGENYEELLKEEIIDVLMVWLYHKYSSYGKQAVLDFMDKYNHLKERMLITIGLFPKENPPEKCEIVSIIQMLLSAGWNVCYAGYPPMLIQDERWTDVWPRLKGFVPRSTYNPTNQQIVVDPARSVDVPFYVRF